MVVAVGQDSGGNNNPYCFLFQKCLDHQFRVTKSRSNGENNRNKRKKPN